MNRELILAGFVIAIGLCVAAVGTYLYQGLTRQRATLRFDGETTMQALGNLAMSFLCGPFIMLQLSWNNEDGVVSLQSAMISALVAFGWSFLTGLLIVGIYVGLRY